MTNGFETRIDDGAYPERKVATVYSKRDLEKMFNLRAMRTSLEPISIDKSIAGRYYQESAVKAVRGEKIKTEPLPFSVVRGEDIYDPENEKLLFPVAS